MKYIFTHFVRPYWKRSLLSLILLLISVVLELAIPRLVQRIIDQGILAGNMQEVWQPFLLMLVIVFINTLFAIGNNSLAIQVGESIARDLRQALFLKVQTFSFGNLDRIKTGQLMVHLSSDSSIIQRVVQFSLRIGTRAPLIIIGSIFLMLNTDRTMAIIMLPVLMIISVIIYLFMSRMGPLFMAVQQKLDRLNTILQENIAGVRVVKAFVRAGHETERFESANREFTERNIRVMRFMSIMRPTLNVCINIGIVLIIWIGGLRVMSKEMTTGELVAFINYLQIALFPLLIMGDMVHIWAAGTASAKRVCGIFEIVPEVQDITNAPPLPPSTRPRIEFRNVGFSYDGPEGAPILTDINLVAEPGQTVAILGATGVGKSTLVNLIPRFYDVTEGCILIDGRDIREVQQASLLERISIVHQETVLFSGSVRHNIRYGRPQASDEEVVKAACAAQAHDFILNLPNGYETRVEERGVNLSGGQKQRIAIARALLTRPDILILDDSTSSVDVETEIKIEAALKTWMAGRTCFMVAQRISTVLKADKIVVIEKGRIIAEGTHRQLLESNPVYQEIFASQLGDGNSGV